MCPASQTAISVRRTCRENSSSSLDRNFLGLEVQATYPVPNPPVTLELAARRAIRSLARHPGRRPAAPGHRGGLAPTGGHERLEELDDGSDASEQCRLR